MSTAEKSKKAHHFLLAGEIVFRLKAEPDGVHAIRLNAVVTHDTGDFPARMIGRGQQALQMHFFKRFQPNDVDIVDVVLMHVSDLGYMTTEEFSKPAEPTELQAQAAAVVKEALGKAKGEPVGKSTPGLKLVQPVDGQADAAAPTGEQAQPGDADGFTERNADNDGNRVV
jgi:hypothetical protein